LIGRIAQETKRLRVGSGGVMLTHYSPLKVAEQFACWRSSIRQDRSRPGTGARFGPDDSSRLAIRTAGLADRCVSQSGSVLRQFLDDAAGKEELPDTHPYRGIHAMPRGATPGPELWMLGSAFTARSTPPNSDCRSAMLISSAPMAPRTPPAEYHARFNRVPRARAAPLAWCGALVGETEDEARDSRPHAIFGCAFADGRPIPFPSPEEALAQPLSPQEEKLLASVAKRSIMGTGAQVREKLSAWPTHIRAEELVVVTITYDYARG